MEKKDSYFLNGPTDFLLLGGGSLIVFLLFYFSGWDAKGHQTLILSSYLAWVVNWPHFAATLTRLKESEGPAREFPLTLRLVPVLIGIAMFASLSSPELLAPYFIKLYLLWSPYHFSGQTVGVTLLYARRNGMSFTGWGRRMLSGFVFSTFIYTSLLAEVSLSGSHYFGVIYPGFGIPEQVPEIFFWVLVAFGLGFLFFYLKEARRAGWSFFVLLPLLSQLVWFVPGRNLPGFYALVPFFHSLQYLPIVWAMSLAEKKSPRGLGQESLYWFAGNVVLGIALFYIFPRLVSYTGISYPLAAAVLLAGIQIHHFFLDGVLWKLKSTHVSRALTQNVLKLARTA